MTANPAEVNCREVTDLLADYVAEELQPAAAAAIETHLHACADCTAFLNTYRATLRATRALPCEAIPDALYDRLRGLLRME